MLFASQVYSQSTGTSGTSNRITPSRNNTGTPATGLQQNNMFNPVNPTQVQARSMNRTTGTARTNTITRRVTTSKTTTQAKSTSSGPFVGGIHASDNAKKTYDTLSTDSLIRINTSTEVNASSDRGNDTTFNTHTITNGNIPTNSGAVDKSGRTQFGQTNWGSSRSTIGESQWTVPPPISSSFNQEFPNAANATWSRNIRDTSVYSARYQSGASWVTSSYNMQGQPLYSLLHL